MLFIGMIHYNRHIRAIEIQSDFPRANHEAESDMKPRSNQSSGFNETLDTFDELIEVFESQWQTGTPPSIGRLLLQSSATRKISASDRLRLLAELIKVDLEYRWREYAAVPSADSRRPPGSGERLARQDLPKLPRVEDYMHVHPDLAAADELLTELLAEEYRVRRRHEDEPSIDSYLARFPHLARRLRHDLYAIAAELSDHVLDDDFPDPLESQTLLNQFNSTFIGRRTAPVGPEEPANTRERGDAEGRPSNSERVAFLSTVEPFSELPSSVVNEMASRMVVREFGVGDALIRAGDIDDCLVVVVQEGDVETSVLDEFGQAHAITHQRAPAVLGEFAVLSGLPHLVTVTATTPVTALYLSPADFSSADFSSVTQTSPLVSMVFAELMAKTTSATRIDAFYHKNVNGYRIRGRIARGAMAVIYEAQDCHGKTVALKMMKHHLAYDAEAVKRFQREAKILSSLRHPNIMRCLESFWSYGTFFLVLEHCGAGTLADAIALRAPFPEEQVRQTIGQLANALGHVHANGIVHRDLKPDNVLVQPDGSVFLIDFGLSRSSQSIQLTNWGQVLGTPRYMPAEQLVGAPIDKTVDLYALGCIAYEMLTGSSLFQSSQDTMDLLREKLRLPPQLEELASRVSPGMYSFLRGSLAADSHDRVLKLETIAEWA